MEKREEGMEQEFGILSSVFKCFRERETRKSGGNGDEDGGVRGGRKCGDVRVAATSYWRLE